jgi:23S rRNA (uridine2479-2'-O)-methyltransferase
MIRAVQRADATFQVLDALRTNRRKRRQRGEFLIHGVRPINAALERRWPVTGLITATDREPSKWVEHVVALAPTADRYELAPALFDALSERDDPAELIAVGAVQTASLDDISGDGPLLVLDRPSSPGNLGALIRSADAFAAAGVVLLGHAADQFDPQTVRASVGSLFAVPVVELGGAGDLEAWLHASGRSLIGLDEAATRSLGDVDRGRAVAIVLGNEGRGLAGGVRALCDELVAIPMQAKEATSLNVAIAGSIALYEVTREP